MANDLDDLKHAVEDSIKTLRVQLYTVTEERNIAMNKLYVMEKVHDKTKPALLDKFVVGFIVGSLVVIGTGIVLNGTWE